MNGKIRLDKFLASQTGLSRTDAKKKIRSGDVTVNGERAKTGDMTVDTQNDTVMLDGDTVGYKKYVYIMLNKPRGIVSASRSDDEKTVVDLVPPTLYRKGLFPAGRLDKDSTGFVLLTDDGEFAHSVLSPSRHVPKTYIVTASKPLSKENTDTFKVGVPLSDGVTKPAFIAEADGFDTDRPVYSVTLTEGRYHQIKRMFAFFGSEVTGLHRVSFGSLPLDKSLLFGECREILPEELALIKKSS